ncbi:hypothetical protein DNTS_009123 [Danionella cerebrum]|uniref:Lebercilin domain-containing protein n=1 Tax=Danionella cerebrum TaxID=2873325 RepID=A0A553QAR5_9TELE|nr:hypothetical protein DNTS_009123 [Danionella translucida]TRY87020.1 hypothetical protein DNTS_009123 [Danionella translucida]
MDLHERNQASENSRMSPERTGKISESSLRSEKSESFRKDTECSSGDRAQRKSRESDHCSDGGRSSGSFYSEDYDNVSHSDRSLSPSPRRRERSRRISSSPLQRTGVRKGITRRPPPHSHHPQQRSTAIRSQSLSKDAPSKDLDVVTKRMLSARLLKINELKNALSELRLHADELQRENRLLRQLQLRHEKALNRYNDTESEISQLLARHNNETHVLRERLRRSQEKQRTAERSLRETDTQLQRCRNQIQKLQQLADDHSLGEREELARKLTFTQSKLQDSERRVKELEKNLELNTGSFQRQLASERRKTHDVQQEVNALQEEVEKLCTKLKEKEKELDARNIYANRIHKNSSRREIESSNIRKGASSCSTKAVQTEDRTSSLDFPSPPPALTNGPLPDDQTDEYLSLKDQQREHRPRESKEWKIQEFWREREKERDTEVVIESEKETAKETTRLDREEEDWRTGLSKSQRDEDPLKLHELEQNEGKHLEIQGFNQEERQRKEQLLAKMREIDLQTQGQDSDFFSDDTGSVRSPPRLSEQRNHNGIFKFTEPEDTHAFGSSRRGGGLQAQALNEDLDLAFGSYAPSFGKSTPRGGLVMQSKHPQPREPDEGLDLGGFVKEKKSNLMQELFGTTASPPQLEPSRKMEVLSPPGTTQLPSGQYGGRRRDTDTPNGINASSLSMSRSSLQVSESRPVVRAITSFDDDIEEVTL